jgi:hypothetical protein
MININSLREFLAECKAQFEEINRVQILFDDGDIINFVKEHENEENIFMLGIIPEFESSAKDIDSVLFHNHLAFIFLEKCSYKDITHDEELLVFHRTLELSKKFVRKILDDAGHSVCHEMNHIDANSISVVPVKNLASCNGYMVEFTLNTNIE